MSKNIDIELIIAYINDEITDSHKREEIRNNIENDADWFAAYLDLKSSSMEIENTEFEVTPDQLLNPTTDTSSVKSSESSLFGFSWLLKPQIAMGAACMLILVIFISLSSDRNSGSLIPQISSDSTGVQMTPYKSTPGKMLTQKRGTKKSNNNDVTISVDKEDLTVSNTSTDMLTILVNDRDFSLSMFDSVKIRLENGDNKVVVVNSKMETIQDTTITVNE